MAYRVVFENVKLYDMLETIHEIKSYKEPPYDKNDPYYTRYPWCKMGGVSSGICEKWYWFPDDMILNNFSGKEEELVKASCELDGSTYWDLISQNK